MLSLGMVGCSPANESKTATDTQNESESAVSSTPIDASDNNEQNSAKAEDIRIAAAANLSDVLPEIIESYKADRQQPEQNIEVTYGSSGKLYAQAIAGAPYDLFLSANQEFASKLATEMAKGEQPEKLFTYTRGQLALYSVRQPVKPLSEMTLTEVLKSQPKAKVTIANPELAPYGASAVAYLKDQGLYDSLVSEKRLIQAENIGQAFQYANTGNVDYGFVAQSQVTAINAKPEQFTTLAPESYPAILQDGVVIKHSPAADDFAKYLLSKAGQQHFAKAGYLAVE